MFRIFRKSIHSFATTSEPNKFFILRFQQFCSSNHVNQDCFTVQYLINQFGFSPERAVLASKRVQFENADKPDAVVSFLKTQGFSQTQINKMISAHTHILSCKLENTLLPKINFFRSKGVSSTDLGNMIVRNPQLILRSLEQYIIPSFNSLRDFIGSDEGVILMLKRNSQVLTCLENCVKPNIEILRAAGMSYSRIAYLLRHRIHMFCYSP